MFNSNRLLIAAAAIGLIVSSLVWSVYGVGLLTRSPDRAAANGYVQAERGDHRYESYGAVAALVHQACTEGEQAREADFADTEQRDLCAQYVAAAARKAADWAAAQTWIGFFGLLAVIVTLVLNYAATLAATEQSKIAKRAFEEAERPLFFVSATTDLPPEEADGFAYRSFDARLLFENVGTRPAIATELRLRLVRCPENESPPTPDSAIVRSWKNFWEDAGREIPSGGKELGFAPASENYGGDLLVTEALSALRVGPFSIYAIGLMKYEDALGIVRERGICLEAQRHGAIVEALDGHPSVFWTRTLGEAFNFDRRVEK